MKKVFSIAIVLIMLFTFASCGSKDEPADTTSEEPTSIASEESEDGYFYEKLDTSKFDGGKFDGIIKEWYTDDSGERAYKELKAPFTYDDVLALGLYTPSGSGATGSMNLSPGHEETIYLQGIAVDGMFGQDMHVQNFGDANITIDEAVAKGWTFIQASSGAGNTNISNFINTATDNDEANEQLQAVLDTLGQPSKILTMAGIEGWAELCYEYGDYTLTFDYNIAYGGGVVCYGYGYYSKDVWPLALKANLAEDFVEYK
jgi:hypothetical protein